MTRVNFLIDSLFLFYSIKYRYTFVIIFEGYYNTMEFQIDKIDGKARACTIKTAHSTIQTPVFMPVGTVGAVKALDATDLATFIKPEIILGNTYHLYIRPGDETIQNYGEIAWFYQVS